MSVKIEIDSEDRGLSLNLRELWDYKFLVLLFVRRDFVAKYKQNVLGPLWFIIQPLLMTVVFTVVFGNIAGISTDGIPPMLFYLSGLTIWNYFALSFAANSTILVTQSALYTKVYFPRMSLPIANVIAGLMSFLVQMLLFLAFLLYFRLKAGGEVAYGPNWTVVGVPLYLVVAGAFSLGCGLWMSALTAKYRDLAQLAAFFVQIGMYVTPVIYPLSGVSGKLAFWLGLNPMTSVVEAFRYSFLGQGTFSLGSLAYGAGMSLAFMLSGMFVFQKVQRSFVDSV